MSIREVPALLPDRGLIAILEAMLAEAKAGRLVGMVAATEHTGRCVGTAVCGDIDCYRILGALEAAKLRLWMERDL